MADYRVDVDVNIDQSKKLDAFEQRLKSLESRNVKLGVDVDVDAKDVSSQISNSLKTSNTKIKATVDVDTKNIVNKLRSAYKRMDTLQRQKVKLDVNSGEYKALDAEINRLIQRAAELQTMLGGNLPNSIFDDFAEDGARARADLDKTIAKVEDARRKMASGFVGDIDNGKLVSDFDSLSERIDRISNKTPELTRSFDELKKIRADFAKVSYEYSQDHDIEKVLDYQERYNRALEATKNSLKSVEAQQRKINRDNKSSADLQDLNNAKKVADLQIESWLNTNSAAAAEFGDRLRSIQTRIRECNDAGSLKNLKSEFQQVKLEAQIADKATMTFGDRLKNQLREYASYIGIAGVFMAGSQALRAMAQNVLEVDTAMTGLYRVTDLTSAQYDKLYSDMIASSKEYGTTLTDTINATSDWVRAGFDADTSLQLADITAMYQHVSDLDYDEASKNLLTAYNGFKDSFNEDFGGDAAASVEHIADVFNELDNQYSVTSAGLGEGLARSASALQLAGNTFEEAAALVGATTEVTQNPELFGA